jgi:hypothetical protein
MSYARLSRKPSLFKSFTGLDIYQNLIPFPQKQDQNMMNTKEYVFPEGGGKEILAQEGHSNLKSKKDSS